jgi:hypothetical protein
MPEETKMQTEVLNDVAEEIKKISNVVTDGLMKIKDNSENTNFEIKNLSSAMSNVKETVNNISLTTDNQNEIQQTQIESLNLLIQETKTSKDELKSSIEKQSKNQSELFKKQTDEIKKSNIQLKEQNKGFKKLTKSIDDLDVGGKGGSGGGLLSLLSSGLGGIVSSVMGAVVGTIGSFLKPLLVTMAAAGAGTLIYKLFVEPALDEMMNRGRDIITKPSTTREKIKSDTGEELFYTKDQTTGKSKVITASEKEKQIEEGASEIDFQPITAVVQETREGGKIDVATTAPAVISSSMQGAKVEDIQKAIESQENKIAGEEEGFRGREGKIQRYAQDIAMWEFDLRERLEDLAIVELKMAKTPAGYSAALAEGNRQQEILQNSVLTESKSIKNRLQSDLDNNKLTNRDVEALYSTSKLFYGSETNLLNKIQQFRKDVDGSIKDLPLGKTDDEILSNVYKSSETNFGRTPEILSKTKTGNIPLHELMEYSTTEKEKQKVEASKNMYSVGGSPMANEGIIEGTRLGSRIIAGENYTSEAVISTKPNMVTEKIGENLYETIKQKSNNDVMSLPKESMMLQDGLNRSKAEYFDMTKAQPLASQAQGGTNIINNILGGNSSDRSDPNTQFNPYMLSMNNPDNLAKEVLYEIKKAELL